MSDPLNERLSAIALREPSVAARNRAIKVARARAGSRESASRHTPRHRAIALAVGCLLMLTPPGISVARTIGGLVGIGDEPSDPIDMGRGSSDQAVIGVGETPSGVPYELATTDSKVASDAQPTCFYLSIPTLDVQSRSASCLTSAALRGIHRASIGSLFPERAPSGVGPGSDIVLTGAVADDVARVTIEYPTDGGPARRELDLAPFRAERESAQGREGTLPTSVDLKAFGAFLPFDLDPPITIGEGSPNQVEKRSVAMREEAAAYQRQLREITLRAYDENGNLVAIVSPGDRPGSGTSLAIAPPG